MIALAAVVLGIVALFGISATRLTLQDLAMLETQQAAQRGAEAAAATAAEALVGGSAPADVANTARAAADALVRANVQRGSVVDVEAVTELNTADGDLANVTVTVRATFGGVAGPFATSVTAAAAVPGAP